MYLSLIPVISKQEGLEISNLHSILKILMMVEYGNGVMIKCLDDGRSFQVLKKGDLVIYFHHIAIIDGFSAMNYDLFSTLVSPINFHLLLLQLPWPLTHSDIH